MEAQVFRYIQEHRLTEPGTRILVAVSGGADSVALLNVLARLSGRLEVSLVAAHLDHALRRESSDDARFVESLCAGLGLPLVSRRIAAGAAMTAGRGGVEQVARSIRRRFLLEVAAREGCSRIALGHHRDDQAETVLHRLLRGSGPGGLAAMRPRRGAFIRPFLDLSRRQIRDYLATNGLAWAEDESNRDLRLTRNRIRHRLLPLCREFNPRIETGLARLAKRLALEEDFWAARVAEFLDRWPLAGEESRIPCRALAELHPALRDRVLRASLERVRGDLRGVEDKHVALLAGLLQGRGEGQKELHLPRAWAALRYDDLVLRPAAPEKPAAFELKVGAPGTCPLPDGRLLRFTVELATQGETSTVKEFSLAQVDFPLTVRSWRPGDRMRPEGLGGQRKVKDIFIDAKVPREARREIPLLVKDEDVLWLVGLRRGAGGRPRAGEGEILRVSLESPEKASLYL